VSSPQAIPFQPGDEVRERRSCRRGLTCVGRVHVTVVETRMIVVRLEDKSLQVSDWSRWERVPDSLAVKTVALAPILVDFVTDWRRQRPMRGSGNRKPDPSEVEPMSPYAWLTTETGLSREEIQRAASPEAHPYTDLRVADALVAAIVQSPGVFQDGTLTITPNPRYCCGGSERSPGRS
jgi:hypothetical protein